MPYLAPVQRRAIETDSQLWQGNFMEMLTEQSSKQNALMRLFCCYPSTAMADREQAAMMLAAYLEKLSSVSADAVDAACRMLSSKPDQFPPSAGVVFDKAREIEFRRHRADRESVPRLPYVAPFERLTDEQKEQRRREVMAMVEDFKRAKVLH